MPSGPEIHSVQTKHGEIAIWTNGPERGTPLVLLPRFRATMDDWDPAFIKSLSRDHQVVRFDNPGVGLSQGSSLNSIKSMASVAAEVILQVAPRHADVLGWSLGGAVAQQLALDYPHILRRMILVGATPGAIAEGPRQQPRVATVLAKEENDEQDFLYLFYPETEAAVSCGRTSIRRIANQPYRSPGVSALAFMLQVQAFTRWPGILHRARELKLPILVVAGAQDIVAPAYCSFVLSQQVADAKFIVYPDSGHASLFQHAEEFIEDATRFLEA
ncbi:alpha/beta hydrolase [Rhizobium rhizogenes]|uniref:Alpha/beta hydrolase n=1 Tax=Rhizobium rhizogenes TaxID=359 RepID=A0AA94V8U5_RHIRH|nr:alpha/beta hydrolase [Rhizobium rhizogenes]NSY62260.1 alpha/beta hydrolase [Agrobacterium tumefaciens]TRA84561.1 alpha/beta hydrolase [Rhizobium rhizogenes]